MAGFDRSKFISANADSGGGDFFTPDIGFYFCELTSAQTNNAKQSGRFQCSFQWKIAEDDEKYPGKTFYHHVGLDGDKAEEGYKSLSRILSRLNYQNDPEVFAANPDGELETLVGSKVRMNVQKSKNPDFPYYNIQKLLESPLEAGNTVRQTETQPEDTDLLSPTPESGDEDTVEIGDELSVTQPDGQYTCYVQQVIEATGQVIVKIKGTDKMVVATVDQIAMLRKAAKVKAEDAKAKQAANPAAKSTPAATLKTTAPPAAKVEVVEAIEEVVELLEENEVKLEVGMMVEGKYKNDKIVGKIHEIVEANNIVKIVMNRKAYPCARDTIKVIS